MQYNTFGESDGWRSGHPVVVPLLNGKERNRTPSRKLLNLLHSVKVMVCDRCAKEPYFDKLCKVCFVGQIERRIRKDIRANAPVQKDDTLIITDPLCEAVMKGIIPGLPVTITHDDHHVENIGKRVLLWTLDDEIHHFLSRFLAGEEFPDLGHGKDIKLFLSLREKELEAFAQAKGFLYTPKPKDRLRERIDQFEAKHPETKFALGKSIEDIRKAMRAAENLPANETTLS